MHAFILEYVVKHIQPAYIRSSSYCTNVSRGSTSVMTYVHFHSVCLVLESYYAILAKSMPHDYMNTVSQLEHHLTGDHIGSIYWSVGMCSLPTREYWTVSLNK